MRLAGKKAVITAGGSGIGRESAIRFAAEGATLCVVDYDLEKARAVAAEIEAEGGEAHPVSANLLSADENKRSIAEAAELLGGIDIFWSHVGDPGPPGIEKLDLAAYEHALTLNVSSAVVAAGEVAPHLRRRGGGVILLTASVSGLVGSQFSPVYSAAKFGIVGLGKSLALNLGADNIRVNVLCPGPVDTPMLPEFLARGQNATPERVLELAASFASTNIPLGRVASTTDVANAALFLASDEAAYLSGVALPVDGGFTAR